MSRTSQQWQLWLSWDGHTCSKITLLGWNNSDPTRRSDIRKRFSTEGVAGQGRQRTWGEHGEHPSQQGWAAQLGPGQDLAGWVQVGIGTACSSAVFQPQLQGLLIPQRKNSSADEKDLGLLQAGLRFSFIPYQDELNLQINKLLRKVQSSIKTSNFDLRWSQRYSSEMAQFCILMLLSWHIN